jgi:hypothetical protein
MKWEQVADMAANMMNKVNGTPLTANAEAAGNSEMVAATATNMSGVEFRVQIGAFKHQSKEEASRLLAKKSKNSMMSDINDDNWLKFYVGHEGSYDKAKELKTILLQAGFKDAFIVAFRDNAPLPITTMRTMISR